MKKFAIIALAALTLTPTAASASWWDFTCWMFGMYCDSSDRWEESWFGYS